MCWERQSCAYSLSTPARPWVWNTFLLKDRVLPACTGLPTLYGNPFPCLDSVCTPSFCLNVCVTWHLANPTALSILCGERMKSFVLWHKRDVGRPMALRQLQRVTAGHGAPMPTTEANLALSLLFSPFTSFKNSTWQHSVLIIGGAPICHISWPKMLLSLANLMWLLILCLLVFCFLFFPSATVSFKTGIFHLDNSRENSASLS